MKSLGLKKIQIILLGVLLSACAQNPSSKSDESFQLDPLAETEETLFENPTSENNEDILGEDATPKAPLIEFQILGQGHDSHSFEVVAKDILKIQFEPGLPESSPGTGGVPLSTGLGVYIEVENQEERTALLYNGVFGGDVQRSRVFDFSSAFEKTCEETDSLCRETITIRVFNPNNNHRCVVLGNCCNAPFSCPGYAHVEPEHAWAGKLFVETDDTVQSIQ